MPAYKSFCFKKCPPDADPPLAEKRADPMILEPSGSGKVGFARILFLVIFSEIETPTKESRVLRLFFFGVS